MTQQRDPGDGLEIHDIEVPDRNDLRPFRAWVDPVREVTRGVIALLLFFLLALEILWGLSAIKSLIDAKQPEHAKMVMDWLNLVISPTVALLGAATGFYYGTRTGGS